MSRGFERVYFSQDRSLLAEHPLPEAVKRSWAAQWSGDFKEAERAYAELDLSRTPPELLSLIEADRILLTVKRGAGFPQTYPESIERTIAARTVFAYARFSWAFWVNHGIAWQALFTLAGIAIRTLNLDLLTMVLFLMGHLLAIRGNRALGFHLAQLMFKRFRSRLSGPKPAYPFFRNIVIAAFPYTLVVSGRISKRMEHSVRLGEQTLPNDPYYLSLFLASALYCYAYTGDTARAEIYSARLVHQQETGKLLRYRPVAQIMALLPFAVRGYGHLIEKDFQSVIAGHERQASDPLINSQFYRAAAIIALYQGRNAEAAAFIEIASEERQKTGSFKAWKPFDDNIREIAARETPFNPRVDSLMHMPSHFDMPPYLGALLVELVQLLPEGIKRGREWFLHETTSSVARHVGWADYVEYRSVPEQNTADPALKIADRYVLFRNVPENRLPYLREIVSSLSPVLKSLIFSFEEQYRSRELSNAAAVGVLAAQVAHDIRSPLAALEVVLSDVSQLPEDNRLLVRSAVSRIRDIANSLLQRNRQSIDDGKGSSRVRDIHLLSSLLENLVSEKRAQFRTRLGFELELLMDASSYGTFAEVEPAELGRVISNLINNSAEALETKEIQKGRIQVALSGNERELAIQIRDNGSGVPKEILPLLAQRGRTFGKKDGSGLGLYHARSTVEAWGGSLRIESSVGVGTTVTLTLPKKKAPAWFLPELRLDHGSTVVALDDDASIHRIWRGRLESIATGTAGIRLLHCSTPDEFRACVAQVRTSAAPAQYLVDYELLGSSTHGLALIEELGIRAQSVLVTSRYEERSIRDRCQALGIPMIPKGIAGWVPISILSDQPSDGALNSANSSRDEFRPPVTPLSATAPKGYTPSQSVPG